MVACVALEGYYYIHQQKKEGTEVIRFQGLVSKKGILSEVL